MVRKYESRANIQLIEVEINVNTILIGDHYIQYNVNTIFIGDAECRF